MSIIESLRQNVHDGIAVISSMIASLAFDWPDVASKVIVSIIIGVSTMIATKTLSWIIGRMKCSKE